MAKCSLRPLISGLAAGAVVFMWSASAPQAVAAQAATPAAAAGEGFTPKLYVPMSRRDFTGMWLNKGGIGWRQGVPPGIKQAPPLTPEYQAIWDEHRANAAAGRPTGDPTAACLPQGMPRIMTMTYPMEIMMSSQQVNIFAEWNAQTRRVYIDGRPLPAPEDVEISYNGTSVGHWEGDVLVVTTVGLRDGINLESSGLPLSGSSLTVKERIWLENDNLLKDEITLIDEKVFTQPWVVIKEFHRAPADDVIIEYVCLENQRNPVNEKGEIGVILAPN